MKDRPEVGTRHQGPLGLVEVRATTPHHTVARICRTYRNDEPDSPDDLVVATHTDFREQYSPV